MKFIFIIIAVLQLSILGCRDSSPVSKVPPDQIPVSTPIASEPPKANEVGTVKLTCLGTCTKELSTMAQSIETKINETLAGECFKSYFLAPSRQFKSTLSLTPSHIVDKLRSGANLKLDCYFKRFSNALGYESADDFSITHINCAKTYGWSACDYASLIAHEMSHSKGFFHDGNSPSGNETSIPYQINSAFESAGCCK